MTAPAPAGLDVVDLTVRFGGLLAVDRVNLSAPAGLITGLIGPNGAGKTTIFNTCAGVVHPASGNVLLGAEKLDGRPAAQRAQRGLGRTFQRIALFDSMTVAENVAMGPEALLAGRRPWRQFIASPAQRADVEGRAAEAIELCGLGGIARRPAAELSTGQRRLVELARAVASPFSFLLLDEPSSGLDVGETEEFGRILAEFIGSTGIGVLLVEHDMALVRRICSYVYVLDFGQLIFQGETNEVLSSDQVRAAYLGSEAVAS
jgi:ABC-type branched-subunit amino acid transport system ATPase component